MSIIRSLTIDEAELLKDFLYYSIYIPEGTEPPAREIVGQPELKIYYENWGIGKRLMKAMLELLRQEGYAQASLAVQKENYAVRMYEKVGFRIIDENTEEYIMLCALQD